MATEYYSLQNEMREMSNLLKSIQKQSSALLDKTEYGDITNEKSNTNPKKVLNLQQKREMSSSAWAKSATKKETLLNKHKVVPNNNPYLNDNLQIKKNEFDKDLNQIEKHIRTRPPQYTIGKRYNTVLDEIPNQDMIKASPGDYDVNIDVLSTTKRSKTSTFSTIPRPFTQVSTSVTSDVVIERDPILDDGNTNMNVDDNSSDPGPATSEDVVPKASKISTLSNSNKGIYSFSKVKRFPTDMQSISKDVSSEMIVHIDQAEKAILPNTHGGYIMKPPVNNKPPSSNNNNNNAHQIDPSVPKPLVIGEPVVSNLDKISYRTRVPNVTTMKPATPYNKVIQTKSVDLGTPGPGAYDAATKEEMLSTYKRPSSATISYPVTKLKNEEALQWKIKYEQDVKSKLGPGLYLPEKSIDYLTSKAPVIQVYKADSKPTVQLERKNYFEQKAKDMREEHDYMRPTNLSQVFSRTPQVQLAPPKTIEDDPRRCKILVDHKTRNLSKYRSSSADPIKRRKHHMFDESYHRNSLDLKSKDKYDSEVEEINGGLLSSYDRRYSLIEKKVTHGVKMKAEVTARHKTEEHLRSHPGIVARIAEKQFESRASQQHYGPQLPVKWASENKRNSSHRGSNNDDTGDGYESPTEEINRMLAERNNLPFDHDQSMPMETEYAKAYLKSSYSGSLIPKKPIVLMNKPKTESLKRYTDNLDEHIHEQSFIGPQLQSDWISESEKRDVKYKSQALKMDLVTGREKIKLHQKGVIEVIDFAGKIKPEEIIGPGYYDTDSHLLIANSDTNKGVVPFSKVISRVDQAGTYGQKSEAALLELAKLDKENQELYLDDQLDIDYSKAKDVNTGTNRGQFRLYIKERYPSPNKKQIESPLDDHLGGSWFEGMGEQLNHKLKTNQLRALDFSKQTSRMNTNVDEDPRVQAMLEEDIGPLDGKLNLEVKDWHPNKPNKQISGYTMQDPKLYPRFKEPKPNDHLKRKSNSNKEGGDTNEEEDNIKELPPLTNYPLKEPGNLINMSKMRGREDLNTIADPAVLMEVLEGEQIDSSNARQISSTRDKALEKASTLMSGYKRTVQSVNMDKQKGRSLSALETADPEELVHQIDHNAENNVQQSNKFRNIPELTAPILKNPKDIQKSGDGTRDWNLIPGRNNINAKEQSKIVNSDLLEYEELDLHPEKDDGISKHKKLIGLTNWDKEKNLSRFPNKTEEENQILDPPDILDLKDVDPGKFKKGMHGFTKPTDKTIGLSTMSNQPGRPASDLEQYKNLEKVGLLQDELILNTDNKVEILKPSIPTTSFGNKDQVRLENTRIGRNVLNEFRQEQEEELKLNPIKGIQFLDKNIPGGGGIAMQNKAMVGTTKDDDNAVKEFRLNHSEELILNPKDNTVNSNNKTTISMSKSKTKDDRKSANEMRAAQEINLSIQEELKLNANDDAIKSRIPGGSLMKSKNQVLPTNNQESAKKAFDKEYNQEVIVANSNDEVLRASRVQPSNAAASSMSNKALRISTSKAELAVEKDLIKEKEELLLNPNKTKPSNGTGGSSMNNKALRISTSKGELAAERDLMKEKEELLLNPKKPSNTGLASSMSNKALRISTSKAELAIEKDLIKDKEELLLNLNKPVSISQGNNTLVKNLGNNNSSVNNQQSKDELVRQREIVNETPSRTATLNNRNTPVKGMTPSATLSESVDKVNNLKISNNNKNNNNTTGNTSSNGLKKETPNTKASTTSNKIKISSVSKSNTIKQQQQRPSGSMRKINPSSVVSNVTDELNDTYNAPNTPKINAPEIIHKAPPNLSSSYNGNISQYKNLNEDEMMDLLDAKLNNLNM